MALICSSCTLIPLPEHEMEMPGQYTHSSGEAELATEWWTAFGDDQLNALVDQALGGSFTIEQAAARLRQAEATAVRSGAARFPSLTGAADASTRYTGGKGVATSNTDEFSLGLAASYELDLWGRVASGRRAALANMESSQLDLETAAMSVAAETVRTYFVWQQQNAKLAVLTQQLESTRKMLSVMEERFKMSSATALNVLQQRQRVAAAEAALPSVRIALAKAAHALAILTGQPPQTDLQLEARTLPELPPMPDAGLPADLLARRPDVQSVWADLEAADWNVRAAQADRLPAITLTGSASMSADDVDDLFDNWVANLAAGLAAPLIDGGRRRAEVARTQAVSDERVAAYRQTVIEALGEVEDTLTTDVNRQEYFAAAQRQLAAATATAEEAMNRYRRGAETYFDALSAETSRQSLEVTVLQAQADLLTGRVQLYRALGGDWALILERINGEGNE